MTTGDNQQINESSAQNSPDANANSFRPANLTENARVVVEKRYLRKGKSGEHVEDAQGMFRRVADALAQPDRNYGADDEQVTETAQRFFEIMATLEYLPNSPTLMNAGTGAGTLSACFVLPLADSMEGIMGAAHDAAMVQKFGAAPGSHYRNYAVRALKSRPPTARRAAPLPSSSTCPQSPPW